MTTYVFSIGRNVDGVPMSDIEWRDFVGSLHSRVTREDSLAIVFGGFGVGWYEGASEASYTLIASGELGTGRSYDDLAEDLRTLAKANRQDSIAFTIGETRFCG